MFRSATATGRCVLLMLSIGLAQAAHAVGDPWEGFNRRVMAVNDFFDRILLKPLARGYRAITPDPVERGVHNFFVNLTTPGVMLNQFAQAKPGAAFDDLGRFVVNSTIGLGGILDVADDLGLPAHDEDCGQTFAVWGMGSGPYVVVPLWGPSTLQSAIGDICDAFLYPVRYVDNVRLRNSLDGLYVVDTRAQLLAVETLITGDRYVFIRDAFLQRREYLNNDGQVVDPFLEDEP